jgi:YggT family protein
MFIVGHFFSALAYVIHAILWFYMWLIIIRALLSWVNPDPYNQIVRFIYNLTEPVLYRVRAMIPLNLGGIDLSPVVVIFGIYFIRLSLVGGLTRIAQKFLH